MNALDASKYFIHLANKDETVITPLKLQKLLYYAQGYSYIWDGKLLFEDDFEAWQYGPVIPYIYNHFKKYGQRGIPSFERKERVGTKDERETIEAIWRDYGKYSAFQLVRMTHLEKPWKEAYGHSRYITKNSLKQYFEFAYK